MNSNIGHYFKHLTCTLFVVLGLLGIFAPASQAATGAFAFSTATQSVDEGAGKVNIIINRVGGSTGAASVSFRTNQISAVAGSDFVNIPLTTLNFAHRERQKIVSVNIINDTIVDPDETFEVLLSNPTYGTTLSKISSSVLTIQDDDIASVDTTAPTVSITSPANATTFTSAQTVTIAASASDNVGVSKVELYDGATLMATDTTSPYSFAWTISNANANNGNHSLTAKAYDAAGNNKISSASAVTVNIPVATAVYETPVLNSVSVSNGNYQLAWSLPTTAYGVPEGGYDIFVDGVDDNLHHTSLSATKSGLPLDIEHCFVVEARWTQADPPVFPASNKVCVPAAQNADTTVPTVSLTSPANSTTFTTDQTVTIAASASDNVGVSKVELYDGTTLKGTDTTAPYSFAWAITSANNGSHSLTAKAYDAAGNVASSMAVGVTVNIAEVAPVYEAPVLKSVTVSNGNYLLSWSLPTTSYGVPAGGYDIFVDGVDDNLHHTTLSAVKSGLPLDVEHCFVVESRWTQAVPSVFPASNKVCVPGSTVTTSKPGTFEFSVGAYTVNENDGYVDVIINRVGGSDGQVSVDFRTGLITAVNGQDYVGIPLKSLIFASGETWKAERVSIINDSVQESEETFKVLLSNPTSGATLGAVSESIITIFDDDAATTTPVISGPVKAFPGAEGFGAITKGGRGGKIVKVTNLNDSGTGSLRQAIYYTTGPRIIVFEVAGVINLSSVIVIREPFVTVAGQTAPAPGITLGGYGLRIYTHDVVLQHLFVRPNPTITTGGGDGIAIKDSSPDFPYNIVIDHCSVSWANDENISVFPGYGNQTDQNVTISNSLVGEGHYGVLIGSNATRVSFLRNAVMSTVERQPRLGGGTYAHVVNNLLYNDAGSQFSAVGSTWGADQVSYAGNTFITGPSSKSGMPGIAAASMQSGSKVYAPTSGTHANIASNSLTASGLSSFLVGTPPVPMDGITVTPVADIEDTLMQSVGARPAERNTQYADEVDERFLYEIQTRRGSVKDHAIQPWTKPSATARDIDPLLPANPNGDDNGNGYTNIEEVLYQMALQVEGR